MKLEIKKKHYFIAGLSVVVIGLLFLFFNESGILKFIRLKKQVVEVQTEINKIETENKNLLLEIDSVKNRVPAKIEKVAREKHNMSRQNEKVIDVIEK